MGLLKGTFRKSHFLLFSILVLAFFLRVYNLGSLPSGFHGDEASFLYNAVTILHTGRDEDGRFLPIILRSFIDPKPALYSYLQIPSILIFGTNYFAARFPAVLFGVFSIFLVYLLVKKVSNNNQTVSLLSSFLFAISPWHIFISRGSEEVILSFTFALGTVLALLCLLDRKKFRVFLYLIFSLCLFLSMYSYHSAKVFLPALIILIVIVNWVKKRCTFYQALFLLAITVFLLVFTTLLVGFTRLNAVGILTDPHTQYIIDEQLRTATGSAPYLFIRLFQNKFFAYSLAILQNYFEYFNPNVLFIIGGQPARFVIPFHGLFYSFEIVFLFFGIIRGFSEKLLRKQSLFFMAWLLLAPIPAALTTQEIPSEIRSFPMIVPLVFFIVQGIVFLWNYQARIQFKFAVRTVTCLLYAIGFGYFLFVFMVQQPNYHPWYRNFGDNQLPEVVRNNIDQYRKISISGNSYIYFALAGMIPMEALQHSYPQRIQDTSEFGKLSFINRNCAVSLDKDVLFIVRSSCDLPKMEDYKEIGTVNFKDSVPEYYLLVYRPKNLKKEKVFLINQ